MKGRSWKQEALSLRRRLEGIIKPGAPEGTMIIGYRSPEPIEKIRAKIRQNPLYREADRREGNFYDLGESFARATYNLVNSQSSRMNLVITRSDGLVAEATPTELRVKNAGERSYQVIKKFDPQDLISAPFHAQLSNALSLFLEEGLSNGYKVEVEKNVPSPFAEGKSKLRAVPHPKNVPA
jgi:hypothetical protein